MATLRLHRSGESSFELQTGRVQLGRDATADWVVSEKSVSRKHAVIEERHGAFWLVDTGSANGSCVNGERVAEAKLREGDTLRLGTVELRVEIEVELAGTLLMAAPAFEESQRTVMMVAPDVRRPPTPPDVVPPPVIVSAPPAPAPPVIEDPVADAQALLGVYPGATSAEVQAAYDEASRDLQSKLASAGTPVLASTYRKNLGALAEARRVLAPDLLTEDVLADLPAVQPSVGPDSLDVSDVRGAVAEPIPVTADPGRHRGGWSAGMTFFIFLSSGLLAAFAFFAMSTQKINKRLAKISSEREFSQAREEDALYRTAASLQKAGVLVNGRLRLCNRTGGAVPIRWIGAVRLAQADLPPGADLELAKEASGYRVETFNSAFCPEVRLTLSPGEDRDIDFSHLDGRCQWDGAALFWSLAYELPPASPSAVPMSGRRRAPTEVPAPREAYASGLLHGKNECVVIELPAS